MNERRPGSARPSRIPALDMVSPHPSVGVEVSHEERSNFVRLVRRRQPRQRDRDVSREAGGPVQRDGDAGALQSRTTWTPLNGDGCFCFARELVEDRKEAHRGEEDGSLGDASPGRRLCGAGVRGGFRERLLVKRSVHHGLLLVWEGERGSRGRGAVDARTCGAAPSRPRGAVAVAIMIGLRFSPVFLQQHFWLFDRVGRLHGGTGFGPPQR